VGGLLEDFTIEDIGMFVEGVIIQGAGVETGIEVGGLSPSCGSEEGTT